MKNEQQIEELIKVLRVTSGGGEVVFPDREAEKKRDDIIKDRLFIQEIINDLERHGYVRGGKAQTMLYDWSRELRRNACLTGRTKRVHADIVGKENY